MCVGGGTVKNKAKSYAEQEGQGQENRHHGKKPEKLFFPASSMVIGPGNPIKKKDIRKEGRD